MKNSNKLGELIASLSKREKKYLQQFLTLQSDRRDGVAYISLYEKLLRDPYVTDAALKAKYRDAPFNRNLKYNRHYLYEVICSSLTALYDHENPNLHQKTQLGLARIFLVRKLFSHASSLSNQIVKEATDLDLGLNLIDAKSILLSIRGRFFHLEDVREIEERIHEINDLLKQEQLYFELRLQYYKLIEEERQTLPLTKERREALFKKFDSLFTLKEEKLKTIRGIIQLHINTALFYSMLNELDVSLKFLLHHLEVYEKHDPFLKGNLMNYMVGITNALRLSHDLKEHEVFNRLIHKVEKLPLNDPEVKAFVIHQVFFSQLIQAVQAGWYDQALMLVKTYGETARSFLETEDQTLLLHIYLLVAAVYFATGDYDECDHWLHRILKKRWKERPDFVAAAHLLYSLSQAESKNYEVLPGLLLTARRFLKKHYLDDASCTALLHVLMQYDRMGKREMINAWKEYRATYFPDQRKLADVLEGLGFRHWVNEKIKKEGA